jgi:hypothetical protein
MQQELLEKYIEPQELDQLRMIFIFRCSVGAISKVCGWKTASSFPGLSIDRHFLGPVSWPSILRGERQPLK